MQRETEKVACTNAANEKISICAPTYLSAGQSYYHHSQKFRMGGNALMKATGIVRRIDLCVIIVQSQ